MPATYVNIASQVLSSNATTVTFSSIPQTFTDLVLKMSLRSTTGSTFYSTLDITFNGITSGYSSTNLRSIDNTMSSSRNSNQTVLKSDTQVYNGISATANTFSAHEHYISGYSASLSKPVNMTDAANTNSNQTGKNVITAGTWTNNAGITTIALLGQFNFAAGSSFYLYGIKNS